MNRVVFILLFFCQIIFSQDYLFDYYCEYEYSINKSDSIKNRCITIANSKDKDLIIIVEFENNIIKSAIMHDFKNERLFVISNFSFENQNKINLSLTQDTHFNMTDCQQKHNFYEINYSDDLINIKRYKKKKLFNESNYSLKKMEGFGEPIYSFPPLIYPLRCRKFDLKTDKIIVESTFYFNKREQYHYKLKNIEKINLVVNSKIKP